MLGTVLGTYWRPTRATRKVSFGCSERQSGKRVPPIPPSESADYTSRIPIEFAPLVDRAMTAGNMGQENEGSQRCGANLVNSFRAWATICMYPQRDPVF